MTDTQFEGGRHDNLEASQSDCDGIHEEDGARDPGADGSEETSNGSSYAYGGNNALHFRKKVLEAIACEVSEQAKLALIQFLNEEGEREKAVALDEIKAGQALRIEGVRVNGEQLQLQGQELSRASWRVTVTTIAPVVFAILLAAALIHFWGKDMRDAAAVFEKLLLMVITGALGWAAARKTDC